jgi:hypothetical protein
MMADTYTTDNGWCFVIFYYYYLRTSLSSALDW